MLLKLADFLKPVKAIQQEYKGTVINNDDPERIGRIQVNIPGFLEGTLDTLPWIYQKSPAMLGGSGSASSFAAPEVNSEVVVEFPYGDIYSGFYSFYWQSSVTHQGFLNEDYPFSYGFTDPTGNQFKINKAKEFLEFLHSSGAHFFIDNQSNITLQTNQKIIFTSLDQQTQIIFNLADGSMTVQGNDTLNTGSQTVNHNATNQNDTLGNHTDTVTGARTTSIFGGESKAIGGDLGESVLGNKVYTVAGDKSTMVAGSTTETFGLDKSETIVLGNWEVSVEAGNITLQTLAGSTEIGNLIGSIKVSPTGEISVENEVGSIVISPLGDITAANEIGSFEITPTGDITVENAAGSFEIDPTGDITLKNEVGAELHLSPAGQVALGSSAAELLDLVNQILQTMITNAATFVATGVGPGALSPTIVASLTQIQTLLTLIKGTL